MAYSCRIEKDSITQYGERLTTFVISFPRMILAEFNTHRMFSRSSASSRAVPFEKMVARVESDPFIPVKWLKNQRGMQGGAELSPEEQQEARRLWLLARDRALDVASQLHDPKELDVHKQTVNRLLEPFLWHEVIVTATDWSNFNHLRDNRMAQPEMEVIAKMMMEEYRNGRPKLLRPGEWHLPFAQEKESYQSEVLNEEWVTYDPVLVSVGRSARVSYLTHDGKRDLKLDQDLAEHRLLQPGHMAPFEHAARAMYPEERGLFQQARYEAKRKPVRFFEDRGEDWEFVGHSHYSGNFNGWVQARKLIPFESDPLAIAREASS